MTTHPKSCIIGAGSSGMVTAKILCQRGLPFDCYEKGSDVGGLWRHRNDNGLSSAYASLHMNTSRDRSAFSDFPMPREYPHFPHHGQVLRYFESYAEHFGLRSRIAFRTEVSRVEPAGNGTWAVTVQGDHQPPTTQHYDAVLVASGHHWDPYRPDLPGHFDGVQIHSHDYDTADGLEGRDVLIVGLGNSACDIACETAPVARRLLLSTRRSAWVMPRILLGRPLDHWNSPWASYLPVSVQRRLFHLLLWLERGRQDAWGLAPPSHRLGEEHPTISDHLLRLIKEGLIHVKPNVERLVGDRVEFADGSQEAVDTIIWATGYSVSFPFFDRRLVDPQDNRLPLYRRVAHPELPNLYFLGLVQPLGAIMPLAEAQAEWVADILAGQLQLPPRPEIERRIQADQAETRRRFVNSKRHALEVDFHTYLRTLRRDRRRARRRRPT